MNAQNRQALFARLQEQFPNPTTELHYTTSFELLIAVLLSAQATDKGVNIATAKLFSLANTPESLLDIGIERLKDCIKTINYYHTKAKHIMETCELLLAKHQGEVPQTREELESLSGVGRKTANVILNTVFHQPVIAVDTHIFRLSNRTGLAIGKTPLQVENKLLKVVPKQYLKDAHHLLILHGRYVCKAQSPQCGQCVIEDLCEKRAF